MFKFIDFMRAACAASVLLANFGCLSLRVDVHAICGVALHDVMRLPMDILLSCVQLVFHIILVAFHCVLMCTFDLMFVPIYSVRVFAKYVILCNVCRVGIALVSVCCIRLWCTHMFVAC